MFNKTKNYDLKLSFNQKLQRRTYPNPFHQQSYNDHHCLFQTQHQVSGTYIVLSIEFVQLLEGTLNPVHFALKLLKTLTSIFITQKITKFNQSYLLLIISTRISAVYQ